MFSGEHLVRHQCPDCDVIFGNQRMLGLSPAQMAREYEELSRVYQEPDLTDWHLVLIALLSPTPPKLYLNWGAGNTSRMAQAAKARGLTVHEYDPYVVPAPPGMLRDVGQLSHYDGIISHNFIEHMPDPVAGLRLMLAHLKPGGAMAHATDCFSYAYAHTKYHLFFFVGRSVDTMAERAGLRAVRHDARTFLFYPVTP